MSELNDTMRFSFREDIIDIESYLNQTETGRYVKKIDIDPGEGNLYVKWGEQDDE